MDFNTLILTANGKWIKSNQVNAGVDPGILILGDCWAIEEECAR